MNSEKPLPLVSDPDGAPYWAAAKRHRLSLQQCDQCHSFLYPPGPACPHCGSSLISYNDIGSEVTGRVYSYIISYRAFVAGFSDDVPYVVALVDVDGVPDVKILADLIDCRPDEVRIGMPVHMTWEDRTEDVTLPQWKVTL